MNTYSYSLSEKTKADLDKQLKLSLPLYLGLIMIILLSITVYFIIHLVIGQDEGMVSFVIIGGLIVLYLAWVDKKKTVNKIESINKLEWDDDQMTLMDNDQIVISSPLSLIKVKHIDDFSAYFYIADQKKKRSLPMAMAISLPEEENSKISQLLGGLDKL